MLITMYSEEYTRPSEETIVGYIFLPTDNMCVFQYKLEQRQMS